MASDDSKPNPTQIQKYLGGLDYPANKEQILERAREEGAPEDIMATLEGLADREYEGPTGVIDELY